MNYDIYYTIYFRIVYIYIYIYIYITQLIVIIGPYVIVLTLYGPIITINYLLI